MKSILVTGASGFIGTHLVSKLLENNKYKVKKINRSFGDITSDDTWKNFPKCADLGS